MRTVRETALAFDAAARVVEARYAFVGGMAVIAWGQPRSTADVEVLTELTRVDPPRFVGALAEVGLTASTEDVAEAATAGGRVTIHDEQSLFHIDAKSARTPGEIAQIDLAIDIDVGAGRMRVQRAEHAIAYKLFYGSPQDIQDARSILVRQAGRLDERALQALARELGVEQKLDRAFREIDDARRST